ncbi:erythrocyte binding protein [Planoprotostelium fungivorum]|uniref:Erythrocyte binding protein n=1 Tax=Planoprotostelium fungivorum TaxID=1890364 RepID=A0A2P6NY94_9EUKA|nr:erythrocyte binding protein [Planoprotostelium fungivorum]
MSQVPCPICDQLFPVDQIETHCESCLDNQQIKKDEELAATLSRQIMETAPSRPPQPSQPVQAPRRVSIPGGTTRLYTDVAPIAPYEQKEYPYVPANGASTAPVYTMYQPPVNSPPNGDPDRSYRRGSTHHQLIPAFDSSRNQRNTIASYTGMNRNEDDGRAYSGSVGYGYFMESSYPQPTSNIGSYPDRAQQFNYFGCEYLLETNVTLNHAASNGGMDDIEEQKRAQHTHQLATPPRQEGRMNGSNYRQIESHQQRFNNNFINYQRLSTQLQSIQGPSPTVFQQFVHNRNDVSKEGWMWCAFQKAEASNYVRRWIAMNKDRLYVYTEGLKRPEIEEIQDIIFTDLKDGILFLKFNGGRLMFLSGDTPSSTAEWMQSIKLVMASRSSNQNPSRKQSTPNNEGRILSSSNPPSTSTSTSVWTNIVNRVTNTLSPEELKRQDDNWIRELKEHPEEEKGLITGHLNLILISHSNHKFGKVLPNFVDLWQRSAKKLLRRKDSLKDEDYDKCNDEIRDFLENLVDALANHYQELLEISEQTLDYCREAVADLLFPKIYKELFELFKIRYEEEDITHTKKMREFLVVNFAHLGIPQVFWLTPDGDGEMSMQIAYGKAISTLQQLSHCNSPNKKTDCLTETAKGIVTCVSEYWKERKHQTSSKIIVGGDEFLPLFTYVLIRASIPYLYSEAMFMDTFISPKKAMEQGGYLVATLHTSLSFCMCLSQDQMEKSAREILDVPKKTEPDRLVRPTSVIGSQHKKKERNTAVTLEELEKKLPGCVGESDGSMREEEKEEEGDRQGKKEEKEEETQEKTEKKEEKTEKKEEKTEKKEEKTEEKEEKEEKEGGTREEKKNGSTRGGEDLIVFD